MVGAHYVFLQKWQNIYFIIYTFNPRLTRIENTTDAELHPSGRNVPHHNQKNIVMTKKELNQAKEELYNISSKVFETYKELKIKMLKSSVSEFPKLNHAYLAFVKFMESIGYCQNDFDRFDLTIHT